MEDNADIVALQMQADSLDNEVAANGPAAMIEQQQMGEVADLQSQNTAAVSMMLDLAIPMIGRLYPSLDAIYTPDARAAVAASLGPVLAKHNIDLKQWGGQYQEEIACAIVCGPIALATVAGVKADIAARASAPPKAAALGPKTELDHEALK